MKEIGFLRKEYKRNETLDKFIMGIESLEKEKNEIYKEYMKLFFEESEKIKTDLATRNNEIAAKIDEGLMIADDYARVSNYVLKEYLQYFFRRLIGM